MLHFTDSGVFSKKTVDYGTRVLLNAIEFKLVNEKVLDMGCGYGPIGISIAKSNPNFEVTMTDVNSRALGLAKRNAIANGVEKQTKIFESSVFEGIKDHDFTSIVTNPPVRAGKKVVDEMLTESYSHLIQGGQLVIVLQKKQGAPSAKKLMMGIFGNAEVIKKDKGYYIIRSVK
ncbi:class I SAM-dependent methyltransferase [Pediococcus claussenii]|uniref:Methyltransferase small domain family protein n=1 Tax=Pediococcus claussenii (strain ATCC BAA-344 / DSM 14800 / JCM 18046 / KCTC 3811 / LMG 21948 / P06) TaxID=701521 RepID=G8PBP7_PEDCP|nr:methyltransferase [Pediococcus claussenii]AEV94796.1 methyltransferase small domain family protein [Pediococcus claussenii ATCC BAA-344]KRN20975.1 hypothetical protein IV79_GL000200 [Pediococcus claussenii]